MFILGLETGSIQQILDVNPALRLDLESPCTFTDLFVGHTIFYCLSSQIYCIFCCVDHLLTCESS